MSGNSMYAFSADLTQQKWLCDLGGDCTATPAIGQGGVLYIGTENGKLSPSILRVLIQMISSVLSGHVTLAQVKPGIYALPRRCAAAVLYM